MSSDFHTEDRLIEPIEVPLAPFEESQEAERPMPGPRVALPSYSLSTPPLPQPSALTLRDLKGAGLGALLVGVVVWLIRGAWGAPRP